MGDETGTKDEIGYETREDFTDNFNKKASRVLHLWPDLAIYIKKKIYENSNISPCKNRIFKKKTQNPSRYSLTL